MTARLDPPPTTRARIESAWRRCVVAIALGGLVPGCEASDALTAPVVLETQLAASEASRETALALEQARATEQRRRAEDEARRARQQREADAEAQRARAEGEHLHAEDQAHRPVMVTELAVHRAAGGHDHGGAIEITGQGRVAQPLAPGSAIYVKARCEHDDARLADVGRLDRLLDKPLDRYAIGETVELRITLFFQGPESMPRPCQLELRLTGAGADPSVPLGEACWTGTEVHQGPCEPPIEAVATSGVEPLEVTDVHLGTGPRPKIGPGVGPRGDGRLLLHYRLEVHEPQGDDTRITFKSACRIGDKTYADLAQADLAAGPFRYESGESVARAATLYWDSLYADLHETPESCTLVASLWRKKPGTLDEHERHVLAEHCLREGTLHAGRCEPAVSVPVAPLTASSGSIDGVVAEWGEAWGAAGKVQLNLRVDLTLAHPVAATEGVSATVRCKDATGTHTDSAFLFGVEPHVLAPGETARMSATAFGSKPLDAEPRSCTIELLGGPRFSPGGASGITLGTLCLQRGKVTKKRKC